VPTNWFLPQREFDPEKRELMDENPPWSAALAQDLHNLQSLNQWFGSYALIDRFLRRWFRPGQSLTVLDLCTATADIPRRIVDHARARAVAVQVDALDAQPATLTLAARECATYPEIRLVEADAIRWQPEVRYDFVFCSLALHHFAVPEAIALLRRMRLAARRAALVADLERSDLGLIGIYLLTQLVYRHPMTRHDGRLSMRRAFSGREFMQLANEAGWQNARYGRFPVARQAIWFENAPGA
jgi:ubiquinone/menaquinone biosynthesis C-methylase UbiE